MINHNRSGKFSIAATCLTIAAATAALLFWGVCFGQEASGRVQGLQDSHTLQTPPPKSARITLTGEERAWLRKHPVIRVAQDPGWPPVEFADAQGEPSGMADDYLKLIEQRLGITFERVRNLSWQEAYARLKRWEIDMTTSVAVTPEREKFWAFTEPYMKIPIVILTHADVTYIYDMHELAGKRIAVVDGYVAAEWIARDFPDIHSVRVKTVKEGLERLQKGDVFALVDNMLVTGYYLAKLKLVNLKIAGETPYVNAQCMAVRKDWAVLAGILQKALDSISDRERGEIYKKWMPIRYEHGFDYSLLWKALALFALLLAGLIIWNRKLSGEIRHRKEAESALRVSETRFRSMLEEAPEGIFVQSGGRFVFLNAAMLKLLGASRAGDLIGTEFMDRMAPEYREGIRERILLQRETGRSVPLMEQEYLRLDGSRVPVETTAVSVRFQGSDAHLVFVRDITERKKAEEALQTSEAELHDSYFAQAAMNVILSESLENIPLEIILLKALNIILSVPWLTFEPMGNIQLVEDDQQVLVMKAQSNLPEAVKKATARVPFGQCLCGKAALTQQIQFADHDMCLDICHEGMPPYGHYAAPVVFSGRTLGVINIFLKEGHGRNGKEEEFLLAVADTLAGIIVRRLVEAEREKLHEQLLQAQKMEAVGQLAGGIAHDFNNILTAMIGYGHMLKIKLREDDPLRSYAEHILSLADRAANLTQSLLAFSRKQIMNLKTADLNEIIRKVERLLARIIGEDIGLKTVLTEKELIIMADTLHIEQVFMNLATNARDAMPGGGRLTIRTDTVDIDHGFIKEHGFGREGTYALVSVTDTGPGMDRATREKIFEPFFTTKEVGKGTGLGLSMAYGIIKQHEGYINVNSEQERGTTFRIYLPLIREKAEEIKHDDMYPIKRGTETILLAEDNDDVRTGTTSVLEEFGYTVIEAVDGEDAIIKFQRYKDRINFLILDVIMPKKNGKEAYEEIKRIRPDIDAVFTSGYTADIVHQKGNIAEGVELILKPATPKVLLGKIREILDRKKK